MTVNLSKTKFQSFSLAHQRITPNLKYNNIAISQTDSFTYLGVTFDNKLTWKLQTQNVAYQISKRLNILKRLTGSKWGCTRHILTTTFKTYIQPCITYCCEPLITATDNALYTIELVQNQALRILTGGIKSTPKDAMLLLTSMKPIRKVFEERALILYEKLIRSSDGFWYSYNTKERRLKTQVGFIQYVTRLKSEFDLQMPVQPLMHLQNPLKITNVKSYIDLEEAVTKNNTNKEVLRLMALETINTRYPGTDWLHIYTDGSKITGHTNAGAGIFCILFSHYIPVGQYTSAYDGEVHAIKVALQQLTVHLDKFNNAVILSDAQAAIQSISHTFRPGSLEIKDSHDLLQEL